ncbi:MAG: hypothetical protein CMO55_16180 [Verrucomicrobiales bacterium]|nr:hypothetical protein [Verrucomicrobiales bacterium]
MKRTAYYLFIVSISLFLSSCDNPQLAELLGSNKRFPIKRTLTDKNGREMEASIVGRSENSLNIIRIDDRKSFVLPINRLSEEDQTFARSLPLGSSGMVSTSGNNNTLSADSRTSHTIELNNKEIENLQRQYKELNIELQRYGYGTMKRRSTERRMAELQAEIDGLRAENYRLRK